MATREQLPARLQGPGYSVRSVGAGLAIGRAWKALPVTSDELAALASVAGLRELDLGRTDTHSLDCEELHGFAVVETLTLVEADLDVRWVRELARLPLLRTLKLCDCTFGPGAFEELGAAGHLSRLELTGPTEVDGPELAALANTPLESLKLNQGKPLTDKGAGLAAVSSLRCVELWHGASADVVISSLAGLPRLDEVHVVDGGATDVTLEALAGVSRLRVLSVHRNAVTPAGLRHLSRLTALEELAVSGEGLFAQDVEFLAGLRALRKLNIHVLAPRLDALALLTRLEELHIAAPHPTRPRFLAAGSLRCLSRLPRLRNLWLHGLRLEDADAADLLPLPALEELAIGPCALTDAALSLLRSLGTQLRDLGLSDSAVTDQGLVSLSAFKALVGLRLDGAPITGPGLRHLASPHLDCLMLNDCGVTDLAIEPLSRLTSLTCLHLVGHRMSRGAFDRLAAALPRTWVDEDIGV